MTYRNFAVETELLQFLQMRLHQQIFLLFLES